MNHANAKGQVVGASQLPDGFENHATLWDSSGVNDLGTLGGDYSIAYDINNNGWVAGYSTDVPGRDQEMYPILWRDGMIVRLALSGDDGGKATSLNNAGAIVGDTWVSDPDAPIHATLWDYGTAIHLPSLSGLDSHALSINSMGLIVGESLSLEYDNYGNWRPVLWDQSGVHDLGTFLPDNSGNGWAADINDAGSIVGTAATAHGEASHAFLWCNGHMTDLGVADNWTDTVGISVNNRNHVVGVAYNDDANQYVSKGFYWDVEHGMHALDDLAPPRSRWIIIDVSDINDSDEINVTGALRTNRWTLWSFRMIPVHPTMNLGMAVPGKAGVINTITLTGAAPGAAVDLFFSRHGGGQVIPGCPLRRNALQLQTPQLVGTIVADQNGTARFSGMLPANLQGQILLFQASVPGQCAISGLQSQAFK